MTRPIDPGRMPRPFGPYQLLRRIAVGGMAEVYVALARGVSGFEKLVALKLIHAAHSEDDAFIRMLIDEAKLSVLLGHSNIAQTFDLGSVEGRFYIVMEYVDGVDASKLLDRVSAKRALLPVEAALFIMTRVCQALDYAHRKTDLSGTSLGVIHRDVSPQNVLVSREGDVKLTDFGIAKAALRTGETEVGVIKGKYCYMSPEQAWADPIDHRSDIFSAGAVLYELLTGRMLFSPDDNLPALLERVRRAEVVPPSHFRPEISPEIDAIVLRALARKPNDRFETGGDFSAELERQLWFRDRSWGASRLKKLMDEYVPPEPVAPSVDAFERATEVVTKIEGAHTTMRSQEFLPETSTSMLYRTGDSLEQRLRDSESPGRPSRTSSPTTTRNVVERGMRQTTDPRVERAILTAPKPDDDEEEEATTFFAKIDLSALTEEKPATHPDDESTIIDTSGGLAKQLGEMISLGGARPAKPMIQEENVIIRMTSFRPPKPLWAPLPFVGPPFPSGQSPGLRESQSSSVELTRSRTLVLVLTLLGVLAIVLGAILALR